MKPWNLAVDNKVAVYLLLVMIVILGWGSYSGMPREAAPDISIPLVIVTVPYVGVSPTDIEGLVIQPLEKDLKALADVKQITSVSKEGLGTIRVEFNTGIDIDDALRRVRDKVNSTRPSLPTDILEPVVSEINFSEFPIMIINVGGQVGLARLKQIAEDMQDQIEAIPGVLRADVSGGLQPEVQVNCDVYRLKAYQIGFDDVVTAIRGENLSIPGGSINDGEKAFTVRVPGEYKDVRLLEDIVVKIQNGKPIYIRDVADVDYSFEDRITYARLNRTDVVSLQVRKRAGENLLEIADRTKKIVHEWQAKLPAGIRIDISNDQSRMIKNSVHELENSIMTGMFLVVLSLFMFFGFKNSLLISTAIPISMLIGFLVFSAMGITLNFVVLFGLVLVLGIVVDDAIVVIENIYRHPKSTPDQRMRAFKICAVVVGGIAIILGMQVEPFQINFMVGQAFAIAAASYFPLLFMSAWWRGMTMKGAATGMLAGGLLALSGITLTSFTDLKWIPLDAFWAGHPLWRILCEQPAIWTVPLAILLMVIVSKATKLEVPSDIRMKMLVLHAPEALGLKQEYIQEHHRHG